MSGPRPVEGDPSSRPIGLERRSDDGFLEVVRQTTEVMDRSRIPYVLMGGIAVTVHGRPRYTHDVDVFVRPFDAQATLDAFEAAGYEVSHHDPHWIYKAKRGEVTVDVIFRSDGEIYLDDEMVSRATDREFKGERVHLIAPEDLIIVKALANDEGIPYHWYDALSILARGGIDWDYLVQRARRGARRVLSLLLYAAASDVPIPRTTLDTMYAIAMGDEDAPAMDVGTDDVIITPDDDGAAATDRGAMTPANQGSDDYVAARVREALTHDERVSQQDLVVQVSGSCVTVAGKVPTDERRDVVLSVVREQLPDHDLVDELEVVPLGDTRSEDLE